MHNELVSIYLKFIINANAINLTKNATATEIPKIILGEMALKDFIFHLTTKFSVENL